MSMLRATKSSWANRTADVIKRWINGTDITQTSPANMWIIDFGVDMPMNDQAALYEAPFEYVKGERGCPPASRTGCGGGLKIGGCTVIQQPL